MTYSFACFHEPVEAPDVIGEEASAVVPSSVIAVVVVLIFVAVVVVVVIVIVLRYRRRRSRRRTTPRPADLENVPIVEQYVFAKVDSSKWA